MRIPNVVVRDIQAPVIRNIDVPVTRPSVPVTRGVKVPVVRVPSFDFDYPVINVPLSPEEYDTLDSPPVGPPADTEEVEETDTRDLPDSAPPVPEAIAEVPTGPTFTLPVVDIEVTLPEASVIATAGSVAVVTTATSMAAGIAFTQAKNTLTPIIDKLIKKKFKAKIKKVTPVIHFVQGEGDMVDVLEYSATGTKLIARTDKVEQYVRDQVEINALYEYENKLIIDDVIKSQFTKEGAKRFKNHFTPAKVLAKKLSAKFAF